MAASLHAKKQQELGRPRPDFDFDFLGDKARPAEGRRAPVASGPWDLRL
jgi:hypothetical protein